MVQKKLPLINSAHGSETRNIINELIKLFNDMGYTYDESLRMARSILNEAKQTNDMNQDVQRQINNLILSDGESDAEVIQARGDAPLLKDRLDKTDAQLEQNGEKLSTNRPTTRRNLPKRPIITFIDDDGFAKSHNRFYPMMQSRGMVASCALITSRIGLPNYMTSNNVKELIDNGWEMLGHTHDAHTDSMFDYTTDYLIKDTEECRRQLGLLGSTSRGFVYPQSKDTETIQQVVQKHFDFSFGLTGINQTENINPMNITRIGFGQPWGTSDINVLKGHVDDVLDNGGWLVFMLHVNNQLESDWAVLSDLLDYIETKNVDVVTPTEGYDIYGAKFFTGNRLGKYLSIAGESIYGNFDLRLSGNIPLKYLGNNAKTNIDGISTYDLNVISVTNVSSAHAGTTGDFPERTAGILYTSKFDAVYPLYNRQEYHLYGSTSKYVRYPINQTDWSDWQKFSADEEQEKDIQTQPNTATNEKLPNSYNQKMTVNYMTSPHLVDQSFPSKEASVLTTVVAGPHHAYQELRSYDNKYWTRIGINNAWRPWQKILTEIV